MGYSGVYESFFEAETLVLKRNDFKQIRFFYKLSHKFSSTCHQILKEIAFLF